MKKIILTAIMFIVGISTSLAQPGEYIKQRWKFHIPVFQVSPCSNFVTEFGSSAETLMKKAEEIGLKYHNKMKLKTPEGGYILAYYDLDNLRQSSGQQLSESVVYLFSFTSAGEYFGFSVRVLCTNIYLAQAFDGILKEQIKQAWGISKIDNGGTLSICDDEKSLMYKKKLTANALVDGSSFSLNIIDYSTLEELYSK